MHARLAVISTIALVVLALAGGAAWQFASPFGTEPLPSPLPVPPFPPRIAEGDEYEHCLARLSEDPAGAMVLAGTWQAAGGGDAASHCQALALIATGKPEAGATLLEQLASTSTAPELARASVLHQALEARLMAAQPDRAAADASAALQFAPGDPDLLIHRAVAAQAMGHADKAVEDLTQALAGDGKRTDALVLRAAAWRLLNRLDLAAADVDRAITLDPTDPEALLERGIERQRLGDADGARADWQRARSLDPNSMTADLAEQNLALLDAGPDQH